MSIKTIQIQGMTCQGCVKHVKESLEGLPHVSSATVSLEGGTADLELQSETPLAVYQEAVGDSYKVVGAGAEMPSVSESKPSKLRQLRPLLLVFLGLITLTVLLNFQDWNFMEAMLDFMGLFFLVFGIFKVFDLKGFPASFAMYDPLAARFKEYGQIYPFIELSMGAMLMFRIAVNPILFLTVVLLSITTIGIINSLTNKRQIRCACLGTWLNLPMTEATLIENALMIIMAVVLLIQFAVL